MSALLEQAFAARLVTRQQWGARLPRSRTSLDADFGATVHHEGPALGTYDHSSCPSKVRGIQSYHMDAKGWADIAYSLMPCRHGAIFECRGRGIRTAANGTNVGNDQAHAVCALVGTGDPLTDELLEAIAVATAWLNDPAGFGDGINGHRDWKPTSCPNDALYARLPSIRARAASLAAGATPAPPPPDVLGPDYPEESVRQLLINVPVSDDDHNGTGRGYVDIKAGVAGLAKTPAFSAVMGATYAGADPAGAPVGWKPRAIAPVELVNVGGIARVLVPEHQVTTGHVGVYVAVGG